MAFFNKSPKTDNIAIAVKKVRNKYQTCIDEYQKGEMLFDEFEDRYMAALKNRRINLLQFLYQEYMTADAVYKAAARKHQEEELQKVRLEEAKERDVAGAVYAEYDNRIRKYQPSGYAEEDNELNRLYGAFQKVYNSSWMEAEPLLRRKFKSGIQNPVNEISGELYEFIPRPNEKIPHSLLHYKTALRRNENENMLEKKKNMILKKAAFLLHKIVDAIQEAQEDEFNYSRDELFRMEMIEENLNQMIYDFRLISFKGRSQTR